VKQHGLSGIIIDAKSGVSGAGRSKSDTIYRYAEMNETVRPYAVGGGHRHTPEIAQNIGASVLFTPHLVPMTRGILATCYGATKASAAELTETLKQFYADAPFVVVREPGDWPSTKDVAGSNFCHLAVASTGEQAIVVSVIDNLVKGAAGQAIHNMNIMLGFDETAGLEGGGLWP
jgi:N-acetyl-gamma-glutamyl-phosphate reductase